MAADLTPEELEKLENIRKRKFELIRQIEDLKEELNGIVKEMETIDSEFSVTSREDRKANTLSTARKQFNIDPAKGIDYLVTNEHLERTPKAVANFLLRGEGLSKKAIGDYLGERKDFNLEVLQEFVNLHEFHNLKMEIALRQFLWTFRLPGEGQKIDRMIEYFSRRYCEVNPKVFADYDVCHSLAMCVIMANTALHNPNVKEPPSFEMFMKWVSELDKEGTLKEEFLREIFDSIKKAPLKNPEDDGSDLEYTFFNPEKEGWLWKQGGAMLSFKKELSSRKPFTPKMEDGTKNVSTPSGRYKSWKRRWFIICTDCLFYFESSWDKVPKGIIPLSNLGVREVQDKTKLNCFELYTQDNSPVKACKTDKDGKFVEGKHHVFKMHAQTAAEKDAWIDVLRRKLSPDKPIHELLSLGIRQKRSTK